MSIYMELDDVEGEVTTEGFEKQVAEAHAMVASGRGDERASFSDGNIRGLFPINTTAAIYLSFFDPTGPANMPDNTSRLRAPLLWSPAPQIARKPGRTIPLAERLPTRRTAMSRSIQTILELYSRPRSRAYLA
jgi:hypothetical protein